MVGPVPCLEQPHEYSPLAPVTSTEMGRKMASLFISAHQNARSTADDHGRRTAQLRRNRCSGAGLSKSYRFQIPSSGSRFQVPSSVRGSGFDGGPGFRVLKRQARAGHRYNPAMARVTTLILLLAAVGISGQGQSLAPFVPTPPDVVDRMLRLARAGPGDVVYDLGCGDGRIVIAAAAKFGARGVGVDIDPTLVARAEANARSAGVQDRVRFRVQDAMTVDVSEATIVTLYLLAASNAKLRPLLTTQLSRRLEDRGAQLSDWRLGARAIDNFTDEAGVQANALSVDGGTEGRGIDSAACRRTRAYRITPGPSPARRSLRPAADRCGPTCGPPSRARRVN